MIHLLKKELLIQKKSFLFLFVYGIFMFIVFSDPSFGGVVYIMGMIVVIYFFLITANMEEEKNKSEIILNSLPLPRNRLVLAKYFSVLVYIFIGATFLGLLGLLFQLPVIPITPKLISLADLLAAFLAISIYVSIYLPLYFRFGSAALRLFSILFFLFFFFIPRYLAELYLVYKETEKVRFLQSFFVEGPLLIPVIVIIAFALLLLAVSYLLSRKIYLQREF
ncbi:MAG: ABC-2 transporter permease [Dethiobacteria bacterium]|jgi:ABC-2 type transport system permease protein